MSAQIEDFLKERQERKRQREESEQEIAKEKARRIQERLDREADEKIKLQRDRMNLDVKMERARIVAEMRVKLIEMGKDPMQAEEIVPAVDL
jgi:uncharacterized surface protein with fasciclin (FAS1) repeats